MGRERSRAPADYGRGPLVQYPAEWMKLKWPALRDRLYGALEELAHDPATGLNWPPTDDVDVAWALDLIVNEEGLLENPAKNWGEQLLDQAEVQALDRLAAAARQVMDFGRRQPLDFGTVPPFPYIPDADEAYGHPSWPEVAHAAQALVQLMARWGTPTFPAPRGEEETTPGSPEAGRSEVPGERE